MVPDEETINRIAETLKISGMNISDPEICKITYFPVKILRGS